MCTGDACGGADFLTVIKLEDDPEAAEVILAALHIFRPHGRFSFHQNDHECVRLEILSDREMHAAEARSRDLGHGSNRCIDRHHGKLVMLCCRSCMSLHARPRAVLYPHRLRHTPSLGICRIPDLLWLQLRDD